MSKVDFDDALGVEICATIERARKFFRETRGIGAKHIDEAVTMLYIIESIRINIGANCYMYGDHLNGVTFFFRGFPSVKDGRASAKKLQLIEKSNQLIGYVERYLPNFGNVLMRMHFEALARGHFGTNGERALRNLAMHWCGIEPGDKLPQVNEGDF